MNRMMIVAAREISARKLLFVTAPLWGLLIAGLGVLHEDRSGGINAPTICALIFGIVMSLVIGSGLVGRELAERRLSFHFARPLSGTAIWGGKLLGGLVAVVASQL